MIFGVVIWSLQCSVIHFLDLNCEWCHSLVLMLCFLVGSVFVLFKLLSYYCIYTHNLGFWLILYYFHSKYNHYYDGIIHTLQFKSHDLRPVIPLGFLLRLFHYMVLLIVDVIDCLHFRSLHPPMTIIHVLLPIHFVLGRALLDPQHGSHHFLHINYLYYMTNQT